MRSILDQYDDGVGGDILASIDPSGFVAIDPAKIQSPYRRIGFRAATCQELGTVQELVEELARYLPPHTLAQVEQRFFSATIVPDEEWV